MKCKTYCHALIIYVSALSTDLRTEAVFHAVWCLADLLRLAVTCERAQQGPLSWEAMGLLQQHFEGTSCIYIMRRSSGEVIISRTPRIFSRHNALQKVCHGGRLFLWELKHPFFNFRENIPPLATSIHSFCIANTGESFIQTHFQQRTTCRVQTNSSKTLPSISV